MDKDIPKIEKEYNISVNLFGHSGNDIHPIKLTKNVRDMHTHMHMHINLLVTSNDEINSSHHYVWIRDFNKLCCGVTKHTSKKHFCMQCIQHFSSEEILQQHIPDCMAINNIQAVQLPKEGSTLKSTALKESIRVPFIIYADLESLLEKLDNEKNKIQKHVACSYGYKVVCCYDDKFSKPYKQFRGENCIHKFFEEIFQEENDINEK